MRCSDRPSVSACRSLDADARDVWFRSCECWAAPLERPATHSRAKGLPATRPAIASTSRGQEWQCVLEKGTKTIRDLTMMGHVRQFSGERVKVPPAARLAETPWAPQLTS